MILVILLLHCNCIIILYAKEIDFLWRMHKDKLRRARMINVGSDFLRVYTYSLLCVAVGKNMRQTIGPIRCSIFTQILINNWQNTKIIFIHQLPMSNYSNAMFVTVLWIYRQENNIGHIMLVHFYGKIIVAIVIQRVLLHFTRLICMIVCMCTLELKQVTFQYCYQTQGICFVEF